MGTVGPPPPKKLRLEGGVARTPTAVLALAAKDAVATHNEEGDPLSSAGTSTVSVDQSEVGDKERGLAPKDPMDPRDATIEELRKLLDEARSRAGNPRTIPPP